MKVMLRKDDVERWCLNFFAIGETKVDFWRKEEVRRGAKEAYRRAKVARRNYSLCKWKKEHKVFEETRNWLASLCVIVEAGNLELPWIDKLSDEEFPEVFC